VAAPERTVAQSTPPVASAPDEILRFRISERQMHWAVAIPFMVSYVTAVLLFAVYNPHPDRPLRWVVSWTHRLSGVSLVVFPLWIVVRHWYDVAIHMSNIREVWRWTLADLRWLLMMGPAMVSRKVALPEQGKFNAAEKINFMVLTATAPLYLCTGVMIWSHQFAYAAWVVHFAMALAATPLLFGHVFMATVNPDTRVGLSGMVTGFVNRHWASHHYGRWYRENFAAPAVAPPAGETKALPPPMPATVPNISERAADAPVNDKTPPDPVAPDRTGRSDGSPRVAFPTGSH